ncbi:MAG: CDP-alcohol phosphatidyltransferase family protein [Anaerolineales bacterium]
MSPRKRVSRSLLALRRKWLALFVFSLFAISGLSLFVYSHFREPRAIGWGTVSALTLALQMFHLRPLLNLNVSISTRRLAGRFGPGTQLSLLRMLGISMLSGFIGVEKISSGLAWAPFGLYLLANIADLFDGYAARLSGHQTLLGERLDLDLDGRGLLIASILVYQYGRVGWWFLLVGAARYLFMFGSWLRLRRGLRVHKLKENLGRRALAGTQMGLCTALLAPVFSPPETIVAAGLFMIPFLANFSYDWLQVSGGVKRVDSILQRLSGLAGLAKHWLPVFLRLVASAILFQWAALASSFPALQMLNFLFAFALLLGVAVRILSIAVLIEIGFLSQIQPGWALLICCTTLLFLGSGSFSLWRPEDYLIKRRLGER